MKKISAIVAILVTLFAFSASANSQQISTAINVFDKYIASPGFVPHDGTVVQTDVVLSATNGFSLEVWGSSGTDFKPNFGREIDVTVAWSNAHVGLALSIFDLNNVLSAKTTDIVQPSIELHQFVTAGSHSFTAYARAEYNACTRSFVLNSAANGIVGLKHNWQVSSVFSTSQKLQVLYNDGIFGSQSGFITRFDLGVSAKVSEAVSLNGMVKNSIPSRSLTDRREITAFGFGVSSNFPL
ncbi:MAG: hypothetical protein G01um101420_230 [Parcubacteria group bacterium Gr01-1014_20]|nr:MAG: hypothetical protein G01um101420_230 [Parcubacteria group bacterium Gr01-1014_20]